MMTYYRSLIILGVVVALAELAPNVQAQPLQKKLSSSDLIIVQNNGRDAFNQGIAKLKAGDYSGAIENFSQAIRSNPNYAEAYNNRGVAIRDYLRDYQRALEDFNQAIKINPNYAEAYNNRGLAHFYLGNDQESIEDLERATQLNPQDTEAKKNQDLVYNYYLGQRSRASVSDYEIIQRANADRAEALNIIGLRQTTDRNYKQAIDSFSEVIRINPKNAEGYLNRAIAYSELEDKQRAIEDFQKAAQLFAEQGNTYRQQDALSKLQEIQQQ